MARLATLISAVVTLLVCLGIVMLTSTSGVRGDAQYQDALYFLKRQITWVAVAIPLFIGLTRMDYRVLRRLSIPLYIAAVLLLIAVFLPVVGVTSHGASRWIRLGPANFQPSELAKIAVVVVLAAWIERVGRRIVHFRFGMLIPGALLGLVVGLMVLEPDIGTAVLVTAVGFGMLFVAGARLTYLLVAGLGAALLFSLYVLQDPVRMERIRGYLYPEQHQEAAYHLQQSKLAFIRGGAIGVGLGNSVQKRFYLPEAHNDFILAIIGEELGFGFTLMIVLSFFLLGICGMVISLRAPDAFGRFLAFGLAIMVVAQSVINIGVVTGVFPTKGLPLPFISYGGSSMLSAFACMGILMNIALMSRAVEKPRAEAIPVRPPVYEF